MTFMMPENVLEIGTFAAISPYCLTSFIFFKICFFFSESGSFENNKKIFRKNLEPSS